MDYFAISQISGWPSQNWEGACGVCDGELNCKYWLLVVSMYHLFLCIF